MAEHTREADAVTRLSGVAVLRASRHRSVAETAYLREWAILNEREQCMFEIWLAGQMEKTDYDLRCREINDAFAALEAKRLGMSARAAA